MKLENLKLENLKLENLKPDNLKPRKLETRIRTYWLSFQFQIISNLKFQISNLRFSICNFPSSILSPQSSVLHPESSLDPIRDENVRVALNLVVSVRRKYQLLSVRTEHWKAVKAWVECYAFES